MIGTRVRLILREYKYFSGVISRCFIHEHICRETIYSNAYYQIIQLINLIIKGLLVVANALQLTKCVSVLLSLRDVPVDEKVSNIFYQAL